MSGDGGELLLLPPLILTRRGQNRLATNRLKHGRYTCDARRHIAPRDHPVIDIGLIDTALAKAAVRAEVP
jgi:hypothetical protein